MILFEACVTNDTPVPEIVPGLVSTISTATPTTSTTATISGDVVNDGGASITARGIAYSTLPNPTIANNTAPGGTGLGAFTTTLTGLTANTLYYARAYATNVAGTSYGGEVNVFTAVTDVDGNVYNTVTIGSQIWMTENLKVTHYRNGDLLPNVTDIVEWNSLSTGAYCNYDNDLNNGAIYGSLYNWYAVNDPRQIAPPGWHVPSIAEWTVLYTHLGLTQPEDTVAGGKMKEAGTVHWLTPNKGANNSSGFTALPSGVRAYNGTFNALGIACVWRINAVASWAAMPSLYYANAGLSFGSNCMSCGNSVRCIKD
jgi:uncharacterized protein (TIGR02145 family)